MFLGALVIIVVGVLVANYFRDLANDTAGNIEEAGVQNQISNEQLTYVVEEGDTLWTVSQDFYDTGYN